MRDPLVRERDACGVGFVADAAGRSSRGIVEAALEGLCRVKHRGALAADAKTGDGAGLLLPIPWDVLSPNAPPRPGGRGVAMVFLDPREPARGRAVVEEGCRAEGLDVTAWRRVPVDETALGREAAATRPLVEQALVVAPQREDGGSEVTAFRARRRMQRAARDHDVRLYVASFSFRTVVYKALCAADQLATFYLDLADSRCAGWFALFHQRYSTNTAATWERAQPFALLAHNGEINTVRGNLALMQGRAWDLGASLGSSVVPDRVLDDAASDSGMLDQAVELLVHAGRDLNHATAMLVPQAWEGRADLDSDVRDFFHYNACLVEPWDGPAALVLSDGLCVTAALDRNGLRPLRIAVCEDGFVACASEAGAVPTDGRGRVLRSRLGPGELFSIDPRRGGILWDAELKVRLARRRPYGSWIARELSVCDGGRPLAVEEVDHATVRSRQVAAGYTREELTVVLRPMATAASEPTSSMGDDTPQPPLSLHQRPVFSFLKQRFAQVTNPPIDHLRERDVMSLTTRLGRHGPLLRDSPGAARLREYESFVLFPDAVEELIRLGAARLDATFPVPAAAGSLKGACTALADAAEDLVLRGAETLVVTDRRARPGRAAIPSVLSAGAIHHRLIAVGLRSRTSIVVECDDARETHHVACLLTNGSDAICPRLALASIVNLAAGGRLGGDVDSNQAQRNFVRSLEDGVSKVMSKMGIASLDSYRGAQIIEAVGLGPDVVELCFPGISSPLGGLTFDDLQSDAIARHRDGYEATAALPNPGFIKHRKGGEFHAFGPPVVEALQQAAGFHGDRDVAAAHHLRRAVRGDHDAYRSFANLVDGRPPAEPRDLLELRQGARPVPLDQVEPAASIVRRFSTGAMSHGALSAEAHETLSVALNLLGAMANTGEGGESPDRYRDERNSGIKQVASGRFGVTPAYLAFARELQIKMAQGSKPGEGGQLPGRKVTVEIARLRHTVPGVPLISPPPHHDIYSIEDLAQLIFDLKQANPDAAISVKLVASEGVGTIAAGVVKALADVVHIAGADGGTGASPLSSIKNAGLPWEIGLADAQRALTESGLRGRARLRVDGGLKTGRDVIVAALLGADEFSFGTAALVAQGCILVRTCHRDTCPVGIATQNPELRARFAGTPEMVASYLLQVAEDARTHLAALGVRSLGEVTGRTDLLGPRHLDGRAGSLDVGVLIEPPRGPERAFVARSALADSRSELGDRLHDEIAPRLLRGEDVHLDVPISNADRSVGARLGCALAADPAPSRERGRARVRLRGHAGQSFGAFLSAGVELLLVGEANDYVGKGMGGGRIAVRAPDDDAGTPVLAGNTVLYGATGGELFVAGRVGERFAVRNSGAVGVVEGAADHACEYMTGGAVVILGPTGMNLGAGMSGGEAYVYDPAVDLQGRLNRELVVAYEPLEGQLASLRRVLELHRAATGSPLAHSILSSWEVSSRAFRRVAPIAEVARMEAIAAAPVDAVA